MIRVKVIIYSTVSYMIGQGLKDICFTYEFPSGTTVKTLLYELAEKFDDEFKKKIYNPETMFFNQGIVLIMNQSSLYMPIALETILENETDILIAPVYSGG